MLRGVVHGMWVRVVPQEAFPLCPVLNVSVYVKPYALAVVRHGDGYHVPEYALVVAYVHGYLNAGLKLADCARYDLCFHCAQRAYEVWQVLLRVCADPGHHFDKLYAPQAPVGGPSRPYVRVFSRELLVHGCDVVVFNVSIDLVPYLGGFKQRVLWEMRFCVEELRGADGEREWHCGHVEYPDGFSDHGPRKGRGQDDGHRQRCEACRRRNCGKQHPQHSADELFVAVRARVGYLAEVRLLACQGVVLGSQHVAASPALPPGHLVPRSQHALISLIFYSAVNTYVLQIW